MVDALEAGIENPKTALGYLELGAKVLEHSQLVGTEGRAHVKRRGSDKMSEEGV